MKLTDNGKIRLSRMCLAGTDRGKSEIIECDLVQNAHGYWKVSVGGAMGLIAIDELWASHVGLECEPIIKNGYAWEYAGE